MKKWIALLLCLLLTLTAAIAEEEPVYRSVTYSTMGYSLNLHWDEALMPDEELAQTLQEVFFEKYPAIRETFGTTADREITLTLTAGTENYISTMNGIFMSYEELKNDPAKLNTLVWFFVNKVINGHPNPADDPEIEALSLGFQFYAENVYAVIPDQATWLMPYEPGQQLTDNPQVAGAFLMWVARTYGADVPIRLNRVLHEGCYDSMSFWLTATGDTLGNLWNAYAAQATE